MTLRRLPLVSSALLGTRLTLLGLTLSGLTLSGCGADASGGAFEAGGGAVESEMDQDALAEEGAEEGLEDGAELVSSDSEHELQAALKDQRPGQELQAVSKNSSTDVRVMSLNIRINKTDTNLGSLWTRAPRIKKIIDHYQPDIIGMQEAEKSTFEDFEDIVGAGYFWAYRTRGGVKSSNEAVAFLVKSSRFEKLDLGGMTITRKERRDAGDCPNTPGWGNRSVIRMKLRDRLTDEIIDVFNTHFPTGDMCEKDGMAEIVRSYVRKFGDNALLVGDFNTGISKTGERKRGYKTLIKNDFLVDTYVEDRGIGTSGEDEIEPFGHSYITDKANYPERRLGNKIDHVFRSPAFDTKKTGIDRSLFDSTTRIDCSDSNSSIDDDKERTHCKRGSGWEDVDDLDVYSDHWAIWADVNRTACDLPECAASK